MPYYSMDDISTLTSASSGSQGLEDLQGQNESVVGNKKSQEYVEGKVIREDVLQCLSRKHKYYRLVLTPSEILMQGSKNQSTMERYSTDDLFGCHTLRHKQIGPSFLSAYVCFYLYPRRKRPLLGKAKLREKVPLVFEIRKPGNSYEDNLAIAGKWKEDATKLLRHKYPKWQLHKQDSHASTTHLDKCDDADLIIPTSANQSRDPLDFDSKAGKETLALASFLLFVKRYLVIVNPVSGQGKGVSTFHEKVYPVLLEAGVKVELLVTERSGHARSMVSSSNLSEIDGIITVGGDGLLYEVVNGLRCRDDADRISNIPLGIIATGSGNGLARSIAGYSKEDLDYLKNPVLLTTLAAARGKVLPVNLMEVELDGRKIFAFLSVGWGLMSDIDVESEVIRAIGESRFTIWSFLRLAKLRSYNAQLTYRPCEKISRDGENGSTTVEYRERDPVAIDGSFISVYSSCQSYIGSDLVFAPNAQPGDGLIHLTYLTKSAGRSSATQFLLGIDKGAHLNVNGVSYVTVKEFCIRSPGGIPGIVTLDGERVTGEEIKVKICPKPLHVFSL